MWRKRRVCTGQEGWTGVGEKGKYFLVKEKAVPEILLKVVEAKKLLESEKVMTIQEATDVVGISRSSFYKYKDDILPFYDNTKGKTVTFVLQMDDEQGLLSDLLRIVAVYKANILTIYQSIPCLLYTSNILCSICSPSGTPRALNISMRRSEPKSRIRSSSREM